MDVLTQGLLGAVAAQALVGSRLPRIAWLVGAVAGFAPDLDVLLRSPLDPRPWMVHHRGFSHALLFVPVGAALVALPFLAARRLREEGAWRAVYAAAFAGMLTHGPLDALTSYGTQLWWPLSEARVALDVIGIIDPIFTLALLVGVAWGLARGAERPARWALAVALAYALGLGGVQHARAAAAQQELALQRGHEVVRARVLPAPLTLLLWRSVYETADGRVVVDSVRVPFLGAPRVVRGDGRGLPVVRAADAAPHLPRDARAAAAAEVFRVFAWFADGYVVADPTRPGRFLDARYGATNDPAEAFWGVEAAATGERLADAPAGVVWWRGRTRGDLALRLWATLRGRDPREAPLSPAPADSLAAPGSAAPPAAP